MNLKELQSLTKDFIVLYVEDNNTLRRSTKNIFDKLFFHVDVAFDGKEGFELYRDYYEKNHQFYDIVISDIIMPNMDGEKLSEHILDINSEQDIIITSAINDSVQIISLINLGITKFVVKPIQNENLFSVLYKVAISQRDKRFEKEGQRELFTHNQVLKQREEGYLKKLEANIKELNEFKDVLDLSAIVAKTDIKGKITYVNEKFCEITKYSKEELIGKEHSILSSGSMSKSFFAKLWNTLNAKRNYKGLFKNKTKSNDIYYVETVIKPILDIEGDIIEFIAVSYDMTQLMSSLVKVRKAYASKENFFNNMSHEMKTPLNAILGFNSLLQKRLKDDTKLLSLSNSVNNSALDLQVLIESILEASNLQDGKLSLNIDAFNPHEAFNNCINRYTQKALEKQQDFKSLIDTQLPESLMGDTKYINRILSIILDNAVKFTPQNGKIALSVTYDIEKSSLNIKVKDNGIGIAEENLSRIFDYEQLDASMTRAYEGAGFGLSIASGLVSLMNGTISPVSALDKGSLFKVEIPLYK